MGYTSYNYDDRQARTHLYKSQSFDTTFEQNTKRRMHESMNPREAILREARDSETHPHSLPIIFGLDITGSMDYIPKHLVTDGLPKLISSLEEKGIHDAAILFMGLGDSRNDKAPFQVGQFESGDKELDMWLTRVWIEGNGGGNGGESYAWAWYFAATRCVTDAWEKRGEKGFIFTVGDDNCHDILQKEFSEVLGVSLPTRTKEVLYKTASEKWHVYHINMKDRQVSGDDFRAFMGENLLEVERETEIPALIAKIISGHAKARPKTEKKADKYEPNESDEQGYPGKIIL